MAVTKNISLDYQDVIVIGRRGENEAVDIVWDISPLVAEFGGGTALVLAKRATDESAYPVTLTEQTDTTLTWTVSSVDSCVIGVGKVQLFWYVGNVLAKSFMWRTFVGDDITGMVGDPPEAYESWLEHLAEMGADILNDAKDEVKNAEAWAVGERGGEPVVDGDETYHNNSKYWSGVSSDYAGNAESSADAAEQSAGDAAHQVELAEAQVTLAEGQVALAQQKVQDAAAQVALATAQAQAAAGSASDASGYALAASGYASDANTYKGQAYTSAQNAAQKASDAAGYALAASGSAADANTYKGQAQGFANAASGYADNASTYANNASGYADAASDFAGAAAASATEAAGYVASLVNGKAGVLEDSASGDVVSIVPDKSVGKLYKAEVSLSPRQLWPPTASNPSPIKGWNSASLYVSASQTPKHYTMRWDKIEAKGIRLNDAAEITTTTTNFGHFGSVNANYNNPFDVIYPWSGRKLCNIDLDAYMALASSNKITDCVTAWEGDAIFSYTDPYGVWVYTPEFWGKSWDDGTYRYFDVTDMENDSYVHYPEMITGRWLGVEHTLTINGASKVCFLPTVGINASNKAVSTYHAEAKNYGGTLTDIYTLDASTLLMVVEFASLNSQTAVGDGVSNLYRQSSDTFTSASSGAVVHVTKANASAVIPGAIFDIGTSNGGIQIGRYHVVSTATNSSDSTILDVTLNESVTVTTSNMWSVRGLINVSDEEIGSKSGYIGTNGQHNAYYRGEVLWANRWQYILGAYRQTGTGKIWICPADLDPDDYDALNTSVHEDTGILLPANASGVIQTLAMWGELAVPAFATTIGGNATNPVGDYLYTPAATEGNTVLLVGGGANVSSGAGVFYGYWGVGAWASNWYFSARPRLKNPSYLPSYLTKRKR